MKGLTVAWVALLSMLAATACGDTEPQNPAEETIEIFGPYRGRSADLFSASLQGFAQSHGVRVQYVGTSDFVADLRRRVAGANPPDIAVVPQQGLIRELWENDRLLPLPALAIDAVEANYARGVQELGSVDGVPVGVLYRSSVKSLVWYRPSVFAAGGYEVPNTLNELATLVGQMSADGLAPWCLTIQARGATGWVGTDWVEDLLVREAGAEVYRGWVAGDVPFDDQRVRAAFDSFRVLALDRGLQAGGLERVLREPVPEAHDPLFAEPAGCAMHRQASFAADWLPSGVHYGDPASDIDVFVLPGADSSEEPPLLVGGDLAVAFDERDVVAELMAHLATPESSKVWASAGSYFAARTGPEAEVDRDALGQLQADLIDAASIVVFDGSDNMPPDIGADLFWEEITAWISGETTYDQLARRLDEARAQR